MYQQINAFQGTCFGGPFKTPLAYSYCWHICLAIHLEKRATMPAGKSTLFRPSGVRGAMSPPPPLGGRNVLDRNRELIEDAMRRDTAAPSVLVLGLFAIRFGK